MSNEQQAASLNPASFVVGGGLLDDADVIIQEARFAIWNYNGSQPDGPALRVAFVDGEDKTHEQYYSAGKIDRFMPSEDGKKLLITGAGTGLNSGSNTGKFLKSLIDAGVPADFLTDDISKLDGMRIHVIGVAQKEKDGITVKKNDKGFERTLLLASKLLALPGEKVKAAAAAGAKKPAAAGAGAPAAAAEVNTELADSAAGYLMGILAEAGGTVQRTKVSTLMFAAANKAKDPQKAALTTLVFKEDFLKSRAEFSYADGVIGMAA